VPLSADIAAAIQRVGAEVEKESRFGWLKSRIEEIDPEPEDASPNIGTWSPPEPGIPGVTRFTFQDREAGFRTPDYDDEDLSSGFSGNAQDRENHIGHQLIRRYKETPTPEKMEHVMSHYDQLLGTAIARFSRQRLPEPAVRGRVYNAFVDAVNDYDFREGDAGKSMQFHNYFMNFPLKGKVKHWADSHRGFAHVPFERAAKHDQVRVVTEQFELDHGRTPTVPELQNLTNGISVNELRRIIPELKSTGLSSKNIRGDFIIDESELWGRAVHRTRDSLTSGSTERAVYEDFFAPVFGQTDVQLSKGALAKKHGITASKLSKLFSKYRRLHNKEMELLQRDL